MRPAPRVALPEIAARLILDPQGAHELEVAAPSNIVSMRFSRDQVVQLKHAIELFDRRITFEDGRSGPELRGKRSIPLEDW